MERESKGKWYKYSSVDNGNTRGQLQLQKQCVHLPLLPFLVSCSGEQMSWCHVQHVMSKHQLLSTSSACIEPTCLYLLQQTFYLLPAVIPFIFSVTNQEYPQKRRKCLNQLFLLRCSCYWISLSKPKAKDIQCNVIHNKIGRIYQRDWGTCGSLRKKSHK